MADLRNFVVEPVPAGIDATLARWLLRQFQRLRAASQGTNLIQQVGGESLVGHVNDFDNPHRTRHQQLSDIQANRTHDAIDLHIDSMANPHGVQHTQLLDMAGQPAFNPHGMMRWRGHWPGITLPAEQFDVCIDEGWLAIANKQTSEPPAPSGAGDRAWITGLGDTPAWSTANQTASTLYTGLRATAPSGYFRYNVRFWVPTGAAGQTLEAWTVIDPLGNVEARLLHSFVPVASEEGTWVTIPLGASIIPGGATFDLVLIQFAKTGANSFAGDWDAKRSNGAPSEGEAWHQTGSGGTRIHYTDKNDGDRELELLNMDPGDEYSVGGTIYTINAIEVNLNDIHFYHEPTSRPQENLYTYTFTYYGEVPIPYVNIPGHWTSNPNVSGFRETGYDPDGLTLTNDAYGIDLEVETAVFSPDWDLMAFTG